MSSPTEILPTTPQPGPEGGMPPVGPDEESIYQDMINPPQEAAGQDDPQLGFDFEEAAAAEEDAKHQALENETGILTPAHREEDEQIANAEKFEDLPETTRGAFFLASPLERRKILAEEQAAAVERLKQDKVAADERRNAKAAADASALSEELDRHVGENARAIDRAVAAEVAAKHSDLKGGALEMLTAGIRDRVAKEFAEKRRIQVEEAGGPEGIPVLVAREKADAARAQAERQAQQQRKAEAAEAARVEAEHQASVARLKGYGSVGDKVGANKPLPELAPRPAEPSAERPAHVPESDWLKLNRLDREAVVEIAAKSETELLEDVARIIVAQQDSESGKLSAYQSNRLDLLKSELYDRADENMSDENVAKFIAMRVDVMAQFIRHQQAQEAAVREQRAHMDAEVAAQVARNEEIANMNAITGETRAVSPEQGKLDADASRARIEAAEEKARIAAAEAVTTDMAPIASTEEITTVAGAESSTVLVGSDGVTAVVRSRPFNQEVAAPESRTVNLNDYSLRTGENHSNIDDDEDYDAYDEDEEGDENNQPAEPKLPWYKRLGRRGHRRSR